MDDDTDAWGHRADALDLCGLVAVRQDADRASARDCSGGGGQSGSRGVGTVG